LIFSLSTIKWGPGQQVISCQADSSSIYTGLAEGKTRDLKLGQPMGRRRQPQKDSNGNPLLPREILGRKNLAAKTAKLLGQWRKGMPTDCILEAAAWRGA